MAGNLNANLQDPMCVCACCSDAANGASHILSLKWRLGSIGIVCAAIAVLLVVAGAVADGFKLDPFLLFGLSAATAGKLCEWLCDTSTLEANTPVRDRFKFMGHAFAFGGMLMSGAAVLLGLS